MRWPYEKIGVTTARAFRNLLNKIIGDIGADMQEHKDRADNIQAQVDNLVADGDSSPEAAQARVGADGTNYTTLKSRLDAENQRVTAQLAEKANQDYVSTLFSSLSGSGIKDVYYTFDALNSAFPDGSDGIYVVLDIEPNIPHMFGWSSTQNKWVDIGEIPQSIMSDTYFDYLSPFNTLNNLSDFNTYIPKRVFHKGFIKYISFMSGASSGDGYIYLFRMNTDNINTFTEYTLLKKFSINVTEGVNSIPINEYIGFDFLIGVCIEGLKWDSSGTPTAFHSGSMESYSLGSVFNWEEGQTFNFEVGIKYELFKEDGNNRNVETLLLFNDIKMPYNVEKPIVFDFTKQIITISNRILPIRKNKFSSLYDYKYFDNGLMIPLPPLKMDTNDYQQYWLLYNNITEEFLCVKGYPVAYQYSNDYKLVVNFAINSVADGITGEGNRTKVSFAQNGNEKLVKIIIRNALSEEDSPDIVTSESVYGGLYNVVLKALGDSITRGEDPENSYQPMLNHRWTDIVANRLGMRVSNFGIGGSRITRTDDGHGMVDRVTMGGADIYALWGGVNDYISNVQMGDDASTDVTLFKPAFKKTLELFRLAGKPFFVITPLHKENDDVPNSAGLTLKDYVDVEIEECEKYGVPILDLFHEYPYNAKTPVFKSKFMPDGLHPNKNGMKLIGSLITDFIKRNFGNYYEE